MRAMCSSCPVPSGLAGSVPLRRGRDWTSRLALLGVAEFSRRLRAVSPAPHQRRSVSHDHPVVPVKPRLKLLHGIESHDLRPIDPEEFLGIESLGERRDASAKRERRAGAVQANVVAIRFHAVDPLHGDEKGLVRVVNENALQIPRPTRGIGCESEPRASG